jgi:hypothetical protein
MKEALDYNKNSDIFVGGHGSVYNLKPFKTKYCYSFFLVFFVFLVRSLFDSISIPFRFLFDSFSILPFRFFLFDSSFSILPFRFFLFDSSFSRFLFEIPFRDSFSNPFQFLSIPFQILFKYSFQIPFKNSFIPSQLIFDFFSFPC